MTNRHFDALGFYEELYDYENFRFLGTRPVEHPDRKLGSPGTVDIEIKSKIVLKRGLKEKIYRASPDKPIRCRATLQIICGRQLEVGDVVNVRRTTVERMRSLSPIQGTVKEFQANGLVVLTAPLGRPHIEWTEEAWRLNIAQK